MAGGAQWRLVAPSGGTQTNGLRNDRWRPVAPLVLDREAGPEAAADPGKDRGLEHIRDDGPDLIRQPEGDALCGSHLACGRATETLAETGDHVSKRTRTLS